MPPRRGGRGGGRRHPRRAANNDDDDGGGTPRPRQAAAGCGRAARRRLFPDVWSTLNCLSSPEEFFSFLSIGLPICLQMFCRRHRFAADLFAVVVDILPIFCRRRRRFFADFHRRVFCLDLGLRGPTSGSGTTGNLPGTKNWPGWSPGEVRGSILCGLRRGGCRTSQMQAQTFRDSKISSLRFLYIFGPRGPFRAAGSSKNDSG